MNVIDKAHILEMKDGAIVANSGHFNVEINIPALESLAKSKKRIRLPLMNTLWAMDGVYICWARAG